MQYLLVHDLGTSGNKATLFSTGGSIVKTSKAGYATDYGHSAAVEQNPADWWQAVIRCTQDLVAGIDPADILAVSFSGHMHGAVFVDKLGDVLHPSMIWMDGRATAETKKLVQNLGAKRIYALTGHRPSAMYTLQKAMWLKQNKPALFGKVHKVLGTKDYLLYKLTGHFVTDYSDASGMQALDITKKTWSSEMLDAAEIDESLLPQIVKSSDVVGTVTADAAKATGLLAGTPVVCGGGDGACATVGAGSIASGDTYCCMGTSAWIASTANAPLLDDDMTLFNFVHLDETKYMPCGTMTACGSAYDWAIKSVYLNNQNDDITADVHDKVEALMATATTGADNLLFLPYLHGERSPWWNANAKGAFVGLSLSHTKADMLRAVAEGIALNLGLILDSFKNTLSIDGINLIGGSTNALWRQMLTDVLDTKLNSIADSASGTSIGAAMAAGVGVGAFSGYGDVKRFIKLQSQTTIDAEQAAVYAKLKPLFKQAYAGLVPVFAGLTELE